MLNMECGMEINPTEVHMRTAFVCVVALVAFGAAPAQAQSVLYRPPNLSGTWVPDAGVVQFNFVHRFHVFPSPNHVVVNYPTFTLAAGLTSQLALGMRYATHSDVPASANETELYGKWRRQLDGPFTVSLTPAYNMAAKSVDGEASVDWTSGSLTLLAAVRGMSKAYGVDTARMALAGGGVIRLNPYVGISGDVASLLSTRPGEKPAWSVGLVFAIPNSPHTFSLHASNVDVNTIEGSSRRGRRSRLRAALPRAPVLGHLRQAVRRLVPLSSGAVPDGWHPRGGRGADLVLPVPARYGDHQRRPGRPLDQQRPARSHRDIRCAGGRRGGAVIRHRSRAQQLRGPLRSPGHLHVPLHAASLYEGSGGRTVIGKRIRFYG